jgi:hypothetical protein
MLVVKSHVIPMKYPQKHALLSHGKTWGKAPDHLTSLEKSLWVSHGIPAVFHGKSEPLMVVSFAVKIIYFYGPSIPWLC